MRKPWRFYSLNRPSRLHHVGFADQIPTQKLRQSWNKYNLYNIARTAGSEPQVKGRATFFQQKWAAKSKTRGYHGEHVSEKKWVRLFSRRLLSAVDLPPQYLAENDGAEQAAGRGSGLTTSKVNAEVYSRVPGSSTQTRSPAHPYHRKTLFGDTNDMLSQHFQNMTPYMQMSFAPLERRLDTAVFRAMFASSVRQARQFIIHGAVKVNGKKMVHPSYALNPGDMFQVQIEKVLYGTGEQKKPDETVKKSNESLKAKEEKTKEWGLNQRSRILEHLASKEGQAAKPSDAKLADESLDEERAEMQVQLRRVKNLRSTAREILKGDMRNLSARQKKELRLFRDTAKRFLSLPEDSKLGANQLLDEIQTQIDKLGSVESFRKADPTPSSEETEEQMKQREEREQKDLEFKTKVLEEGLDGFKDERERARASRILAREDLSRDEIRRLAIIMKNDAENPVDESKPYATPWRPRAYMSAFAFIPRYLEVNPNVCAAVYLRHPVARKGMAEVPTPFSYLTNQLAHNWYLERG
ncbi:hypothetical protein FZEAL_1703 [Fusarium zealandicum]|uniref:RNA-binding S4 domain-containing protein n=1 Tax=Fusarium zealandicum TaxID=1053134 RepID=A0A8H4US94_9HYPO|nr:hypothetical protein FZEAL_1703 [Fusarium zealandicum]